MKKLRFYLAMSVAKTGYGVLRLLGRNATYLPGKVAVKLCPDFLAQLTPPKTVIAVTGTNGKTTVSNLLTSILKENGYSVTNNSFGSNVQAGVATALLVDSTWGGKAKKDIAVLEVDERSSLLVYPYLTPDFLVCNNIMRDSIKRNAHTGFISYIIDKALPDETHLILNGDDLICATLGPNCKNRTYFGLDAEKPAESRPQFIRDMVYCPRCGTALEAEYIRYNHIGRMYCPHCGLKSPERDFVVTDIDRKNETLTIAHDGREEKFRLLNDNVVNIYNFCGAVAVLTRVGLSYEQIAKGFRNSKIVESRYEELDVGNTHIVMQMAKGQNPIACARCFSYVAQYPGENKGVIIIIDDVGDNNGNSESTCWLYDCDYSYLADPSIGQIVFGGPRCRDHYLRALLAGVSADKMKITEDSARAADLLDVEGRTNLFVLHELYRPGDAAAIKARLTERCQGGAEK